MHGLILFHFFFEANNDNETRTSINLLGEKRNKLPQLSHTISINFLFYVGRWFSLTVFFPIIFLQDSDILNLGTGSVSWFEINGYGCVPTFPTNITSDDPFRPIRPEQVNGCLLDYHLVEVVHSSVQIFLAVSIGKNVQYWHAIWF